MHNASTHRKAVKNIYNKNQTELNRDSRLRENRMKLN